MITKRKVLEGFTDKDLYPYAKYYLGDIKKRYDNFWDQHFSTVGLIALALYVAAGRLFARLPVQR